MARRVLVLMPRRRGDPRRVATHSPGKNFDLNARAKAPSYKNKSRVKASREVEDGVSFTS